MKRRGRLESSGNHVTENGLGGWAWRWGCQASAGQAQCRSSILLKACVCVNPAARSQEPIKLANVFVTLPGNSTIPTCGRVSKASKQHHGARVAASPSIPRAGSRSNITPWRRGSKASLLYPRRQHCLTFRGSTATLTRSPGWWPPECQRLGLNGYNCRADAERVLGTVLAMAVLR